MGQNKQINDKASRDLSHDTWGSHWITGPHRRVDYNFLRHECTIYKFLSIPGSKGKMYKHSLRLLLRNHKRGTHTPEYKDESRFNMKWHWLCANSGSNGRQFIWRMGIISTTSCQVPEHVRVILVSFEIVSGDQIFNPLLNCLEVRLGMKIEPKSQD